MTASTSPELESLELPPGDLLRPLGAFEELFCLFDQHFPTNHAFAAEITGDTTDQQWREALDQVQRRHPLLSACIDTTFNRVPHFRRVIDQPIPLRIVTSPSATWQREIAEEVNAPFTPDQAPLFRGVLLRHEGKCTFILSAHHAASDGLSLVAILRDTLLALSGYALEALPLVPSQEVLFGGRVRASGERGVPSLTARRPAMPYVDGVKLTAHETAALQRRAREEGVTVHAAISAAIIVAGRGIDQGWRDSPLRIMSPAEIRGILGVQDQCMVSFTGGEVSLAPGTSMPFWDIARFAGDGLGEVRSRESISKMFELQADAVLSNLTVEQASQLKYDAFSAQVLLTNLRRIPFDSSFGPLKLETLWAPCALRGIDGEQTIGAVTVNGMLHLTHTSPVPIPGLLAEIKEELNRAAGTDIVGKQE